MLINVESRVKEEGEEVSHLVGKVTKYDSASPGESLREFDMLKGVCQENIVLLHEAFVWQGHVVMVCERLFGENVVRSLSFKNKYDEYTITTILKQVGVVAFWNSEKFKLFLFFFRKSKKYL